MLELPQEIVRRLASELNLGESWAIARIGWEGFEDGVVVHLVPRAECRRHCPRCGEPARTYDSQRRRWRHLNLWGLPTFIEARVPRTECEDGHVLSCCVPWADRKARITRPMICHAYRLTSARTDTAVAQELRLTREQMRTIRKNDPSDPPSPPGNDLPETDSGTEQPRRLAEEYDEDDGLSSAAPAPAP
ncbi:MAG: transposase [Candidatus Eisenbacteria bacterium]|nr:transposase [Candidatus Eisenbacteria bacterium]